MWIQSGLIHFTIDDFPSNLHLVWGFSSHVSLDEGNMIAFLAHWNHSHLSRGLEGVYPGAEFKEQDSSDYLILISKMYIL